MPTRWIDTVELHRRTVRDAIIETTAALVAAHGLAAVTMSQIAAQAGVGRATLYRHFADVDGILVAWHDQHVARHLERLAEVRDRSADAGEQLEAVLEAYALISREREREHHDGPGRSRAHHGHDTRSHRHHATEVAALVHRPDHVAGPQRRLNEFMRDVVARAANAGIVRDDIPPDELARYCLHSLAAAGSLASTAGVRRLVALTLAGLRPPRP
jgi:AcrR family transcriptional regulator